MKFSPAPTIPTIQADDQCSRLGGAVNRLQIRAGDDLELNADAGSSLAPAQEALDASMTARLGAPLCVIASAFAGGVGWR
jgi:hypothetical protein